MIAPTEGYQKAIDYYEQALKIDKKNFGDNHPSVARDLNKLRPLQNSQNVGKVFPN
ncbi:MAG: tetratricopeptide repeat protein [Nitrospirae bacterium]|nr:tetratricopeptide repeat protein [Nitrospirota bacterium]MBF0618118.1 tetratricopeptide repeat protein [Nitrospirota bacterium]